MSSGPIKQARLAVAACLSTGGADEEVTLDGHSVRPCWSTMAGEQGAAIQWRKQPLLSSALQLGRVRVLNRLVYSQLKPVLSTLSLWTRWGLGAGNQDVALGAGETVNDGISFAKGQTHSGGADRFRNRSLTCGFPVSCVLVLRPANGSIDDGGAVPVREERMIREENERADRQEPMDHGRRTRDLSPTMAWHGRCSATNCVRTPAPHSRRLQLA
ncbi:hypothetical protein BDP55DRAFT_29285 [Colletotrichum godetiae]|uniref:Uncharacterized protein n=1 Tax=Colletotrichum godetiae TaxID=1209918 RepID=A0AAJ0EWH4_9PEZI|nr:uncharacterized protein BDP55DRAFT_29285 [Colletotrichum godetiae]KAK1688750.1 hypothetical protein BDP55DRAFT_29285 [Colletotrichum godetiae]